MAMMGMREISIIARRRWTGSPSAPSSPLRGRAGPRRYRRELDRGGQVFFVHNRVESIDEWAARVTALVPEAKVGVAHGRWSPPPWRR